MPVSAGQYALERAYEGQFVTTTSNRLIIGTADEFVNGSLTQDYIPWGRFLVETTPGSGELDLPSATGQTILGVTGFTDIYMRKTDNPVETGIPYQQVISLLKVGRIALVAETDIALGDSLFVRHTDEVAPAAFDARGRVRNDASGGNADALPAGTFKVTHAALAGEIIEVIVDFPYTD